MIFEKNVGMTDRVFRGALGFAVIACGYFFLTGWVGIAAYVLGAGTILTGIFGFCAVYKLFGMSTAKCEHCEEPVTPPSQPPQMQ